MKHIFLIPAIISFGVGLEGFLMEDIIVANDEPTRFDLYDLFFAVDIGILMIIFWILIRNKVIAVKFEGQNITICEDGLEEQINWFDIESLSQLIFIQPPLYKLRIKDRKGYYLFVTQPVVTQSFSTSFGCGMHDMSEMDSLIKKKKQELGI